MIRKMEKTDIETVADIWLDTNVKAHYFIPAQYWKEQSASVKAKLLQAELYVYEDYLRPHRRGTGTESADLSE